MEFIESASVPLTATLQAAARQVSFSTFYRILQQA